MGLFRRTPPANARALFEQQADENTRLRRAAVSLLDTADTAARRGDTDTEQRALAAAQRLNKAAGGLRADGAS